MISIGSYKHRQGRMIPSRKRAFDGLWQDYGINPQGKFDLEALFGRQAPCYLEIGFGMGDALLEMARTHPENNYLGVEVYLPGIVELLLRLRENGIANVRIDKRDAMEVLDCLPTQSLERVSLFFPDPWPKKRHHKRRLVQPPFVAELRRLLQPAGLFHVATDWEDYAQHMIRIMDAAGGFSNCFGSGNYYSGPVERPLTKFEKHGLRRGHTIRDLLYERV